jgi:hypothetical protein
VEWIYDDQPVNDQSKEQGEQQGTDDTLVIPPLSDLKLLYNLTIDGNFNRLRHHLDQIEQMDPRYISFAQHVRRFAKTLDEEAICKFLKHYIGESSR